MQVVSNKKEIIFRNDYEGKPIYKIGISRKNQDGSYTNSTMLCKMPKDTDLHHKTWIMIKSAWIDFYLKKVERNGKEYDEAVPYIFINEYEIVDDEKSEEKDDIGNIYKVDSYKAEQLDDLPF